jgi:protein SCO1/2
MLFVLIKGVFLCLWWGVSCRSDTEKRLPYYESAEFTPRWIDRENVPSDFHKVPSFSLQNQHGVEITERDLREKITVVDFFFTFCPGICPSLTKNMRVVSESFSGDDEVLFLSHTVAPEHDTVEKLRRYAQKNKITNPNWHLLTGKRSDIYRLGRKVYFVEENLGETRADDEFLHTENFVLSDKDGHLRGIYNGLNKASIQQLVLDIEILKKDK